MTAGRIIGDGLIIFAAIITLYLSAVMVPRIRGVVRKNTVKTIFHCELLACGAFLLFALDLRFGILTGRSAPVWRTAGWLLRCLVVLAVAVAAFFAGKILVGGRRRTTDAAAKTALVLGLGLENGEPTADLLSRLDTAEKYWRENPETTLVLTGGNPDPSGRTEAAVMRDILTGWGVSEEKLILEDRAESTRDNFRFSARLIDPDEATVLITSDYHMDRAMEAANAAGFTRILPLPAPSPFFTFGANVLWEVALELNERTLKR